MSVAAGEGVLQCDDGRTISYSVDGAADAPWLILSNSLATDRRVWDRQMDVLVNSYRVLRYDTRGHGLSAPGQAPYTLEELSGDVLQLCAALGINRADFMGISLGGMTGLALAMRAPDLVGRLVCCDARADAPEPYKAIWDTNIARLHEIGIARIVEPTLERWFTAAYLADAANASTLDVVRNMISTTSPAGYEGVARALQALDLKGGLASLSCPTLYIVGEYDMAAPAAVMREMADLTPNASLTVLANAAHLSNMEQPEAFNDAIRGFLDFHS
jgi:3-oxoadipate enol-lactonase